MDPSKDCIAIVRVDINKEAIPYRCLWAVVKLLQPILRVEPRESYQFQVRWSLGKTGEFVIIVCELRHTCTSHKYKSQALHTKSKWLVEIVVPRIVLNTKAYVKKLCNNLQIVHKKTTNYHQM